MSAEKRVLEAIEAIKKGDMVIMIDDEDRENEGDLVYASVFSTPEHVNFMATYAKGLICVATSKEIADTLALTPMVQHNDSSYETAFTVSVDAKDAATGISALERDMTIKILANPLSKKEDLVRPGHIFPLVSKEGGVLIRTGHTEGSVDLCKLAGLAPSAVICEIMKENGEMARRDDLEEFSKKHKLKKLFISDLVEYRLQNESLLQLKEEQSVEFYGTKVLKELYEDHLGHRHTVIVFGKKRETMVVKVHNVGKDIDLILDCDRHEHLMKSIAYMQKEGGMLIFINQEAHKNATMKEYGLGALMLRKNGVKKIRLISHATKASFVGIQGFGLEVIETITL